METIGTWIITFGFVVQMRTSGWKGSQGGGLHGNGKEWDLCLASSECQEGTPVVPSLSAQQSSEGSIAHNLDRQQGQSGAVTHPRLPHPTQASGWGDLMGALCWVSSRGPAGKGRVLGGPHVKMSWLLACSLSSLFNSHGFFLGPSYPIFKTKTRGVPWWCSD